MIFHRSFSETDTSLFRIDRIISLSADLFGDISELSPELPVDFLTFFNLSFPFILFYSVIYPCCGPCTGPVRSFTDYQVQVAYQTLAWLILALNEVTDGMWLWTVIVRNVAQCDGKKVRILSAQRWRLQLNALPVYIRPKSTFTDSVQAEWTDSQTVFENTVLSP